MAALVVAAVGMAAGTRAWGATSGAAATATGAAGGAQSRVIRVVAAENFWGSIAAQLGGAHVQVHSIIDNPNADPHDYEPTAADGRAVATADLVLVNGIGYDTWASKLAAANPVANRTVLDIGQLLGVPDGGNPHRWYNPDEVTRVVDQLAADFATADPADASAFQAQQATFENQTLAGYKQVIADIKSRYAGTPVGASESIFAMVAPALGLDLITPPSFLKAISEGTDPTAADKATIDQQIAEKKIKVYVYNSQNATPDVQSQVNAAKAVGIPVTTITETMVPATSTWQEWQTRQLVAVRDALAKATGR
ncbi:MAG: metal ABC transporter solute-binding protein, Zn/Mn family [Kineosporiaceae bacterium]